HLRTDSIHLFSNRTATTRTYTLSLHDALPISSVGGKTGVDLGLLKNQVGVFNNPVMVLMDSKFLKTLPQNQILSGSAEMLKHGLDRKSTRLNSSHVKISYAVFCLKKKTNIKVT